MTGTYLEVDDIRRLEMAARCLRDRLLIRMLSHVGCRVSEALNLEVNNVDFSDRTVTIEHLKARTRLVCPYCKAWLGKSHSFCPGCGAKVDKTVVEEREHRRVRTLPIDGDTLKMLKEYLQRGGATVRNGRQSIFGINRHRAWQVVRDCAQRAGLASLVNSETGRTRAVSPHRLRDAFAVMAVKKDDSTDGIRMLQEQLGHASIATTMRYRKVAGCELQAWYRRLWEEHDGG